MRRGAQRLAGLGVDVPETTATSSGKQEAPRWRDRPQVKTTASTHPPCPQQGILLAVHQADTTSNRRLSGIFTQKSHVRKVSMRNLVEIKQGTLSGSFTPK